MKKGIAALNGHQGRRLTLAGILQRLTAMKADVAALERTLELFDADADDRRQARAGDILTQAIALDGARRTTTTKKTNRKRFTKSRLRMQRQKSATFLAKFDRTEPRMLSSRGIGSLVRRGYLTRKGDGYVRTAKDYVVVR